MNPLTQQPDSTPVEMPYNRLRTALMLFGKPPPDLDPEERRRVDRQAEKEYQAGRTSIVPFANVEPYYDSRYDTVNRVRVLPGTTVSWTPRVAIEGNLTFQYDSRSSTKHLTALNVILHVYFETPAAKAQ